MPWEALDTDFLFNMETITGYDNRDAQWANQEGHDATGRLIAHYFRQGTTVVSEPLRDYAKPGAGDYYLVPRDAAKEVLLEPTPFKIGDQEVLKTTIVVPILDKGKVAGVVGTLPSRVLAAVADRAAA